MSARQSRWVRRRRGQALVELALVVPVLLLLIVGLTEFARAWNTKQVLTDASREALRNSVVSNPAFTYQSLRDVIDQSLLRASLEPQRAEVTVDGWKAGTGTQARIRVDYQYDLGFFGSLAGWATGDRTVVLSSSFVMRNE